MPSEHSFLYRLGYALERARHKPRRSAGHRLAGLGERRGGEKARPAAARPETDKVLLSAATVGVAKVLDLWRPRARAGTLRLLRAAAAGAGAALLLDLVRPLLGGRPTGPAVDDDTGNRMLAGASQGLLYGVVVEPRAPGPPALKGALYGSLEYVVDPVGGLARVLGPHAPHRRMPFLADMLEGLEPHDRAYVEHVLFGVAMATLYGRSPSSNGILEEDEGPE